MWPWYKILQSNPSTQQLYWNRIFMEIDRIWTLVTFAGVCERYLPIRILPHQCIIPPSNENKSLKSLINKNVMPLRHIFTHMLHFGKTLKSFDAVAKSEQQNIMSAIVISHRPFCQIWRGYNERTIWVSFRIPWVYCIITQNNIFCNSGS